MSATPADRALCCGPTCRRGTDATGPCVAAIYGAGIRQRAEAAGYLIASEEGLRETTRDSIVRWLDAVADSNRGTVRRIIADLAAAVRNGSVEINIRG